MVPHFFHIKKKMVCTGTMKRKAPADDNSLAWLPATVCGKVMGFLDVRDACNARGACKKYRTCKPQWHTLEIVHPTTSELAKIKTIAVKSALRKLALQFIFDPTTYVDITGFPALHTLVLQRCDYRFFAKAVPSLANLKNLELDRCQLSTACLMLLVGSALESLAIEPSWGVRDMGLSYIGQITTLKKLSLPSCDKATDAGLAHLVQLEDLEHFNFQYCPRITDQGALSISKLAKLRWLDVQLASITDQGAAHLAKLPCLTHLNASMCSHITTAGCQHLGEMTALRNLNIGWGPEVSHASMVYLQRLRDLEHLDLNNCEEFTDEACVYLLGMQKMKHLSLFQTSIADAGLAHIGTLQSLLHLDVACTGITDAGLVHVGGLSQLQSLIIHECEVSDAGLVHLFGAKTLLDVDARACERITQQGCDALIHAIANPKFECSHGCI